MEQLVWWPIMSVVIDTISIIGSSTVADPTTFADTFARTSGGLGFNWYGGAWGFTPVINNVWVGDMSIGAITGGIQGLTGSRIGTGLQSSFYPGVWIALPLWKPCGRVDVNNRGVKQFAQLRLNHTAVVSAADLSIGPAVFCDIGIGGASGARYSGYVFQQASSLGTASLQIFHDGFTAPGVGPFATADGDILRIEVTPSLASNFVEVFINGVSKGSNTDNLANRPLYGIPGFFNTPTSSNSGGVLSEWNNFFGGKF